MQIKYALVHDWFEYPAGSESCVKSFVHLWPEADIYSLVDFFHDAAREKYLAGKKAQPTFIQNLPFAERHFRKYLALFPLAIEQHDLSAYDVVFSDSHAVAKGVLTKSTQLHICYCHSPMRYAWDLYHQYLQESGLNKGFAGMMVKLFLHRLRVWDYTTANRVDFFLANSEYTARRIKKVYQKDATVIYPPVDVENFSCGINKDGYYITASRLVPYKKVDLLVDSFSAMPERKLVVVGEGPEMQKIKNKATKNIEILGYQNDVSLRELLKNARAFLFAAEEDFGIVVVEALASGTPVIAFNKGGAGETVHDGINGVHFNNQTVEDITAAIKRFETLESSMRYDEIAKNAMKYSRIRFEREIKEFVDEKCKLFFY